MELKDQSIMHLKGLLRIAEDLRAEGITLYGHEYHPMAFGNFSVEFCPSHTRVLCTWDGRDSILSISFAEITNSSAPRNWIHDANISLPGGDGVFEEIASNVQSMVTA